mmetsp:Transcript_13386/g.35712  ORF Transcript_13386/g.35712 Transcript_13386/m.35712 type:complete len:232 (-) Transcript_13386:1173-1868(-)
MPAVRVTLHRDHPVLRSNLEVEGDFEGSARARARGGEIELRVVHEAEQRTRDGKPQARAPHALKLAPPNGRKELSVREHFQLSCVHARTRVRHHEVHLPRAVLPARVGTRLDSHRPAGRGVLDGVAHAIAQALLHTPRVREKVRSLEVWGERSHVNSHPLLPRHLGEGVVHGARDVREGAGCVLELEAPRVHAFKVEHVREDVLHQARARAEHAARPLEVRGLATGLCVQL